MTISPATNPTDWDSFLLSQPWSPFLQSWTMGEVYRDVKQEPIRLEVRDNEGIVAICMALVVPARRGRHLSIPYGPVMSDVSALPLLMEELKKVARQNNCSFIRMSPFWLKDSAEATSLQRQKTVSAPLHLLAEHIWYLNLNNATEEELMKNMRKNTRNLIRRAERDGVVIEASASPMDDLHHFLTLHEETRKRHSFTPYTDAFFTSQLQRFSENNQCTLYLARYDKKVIASSMHMHLGGETSYHHGASTHAYSKVPASYLLQWTAIRDALKRGDTTYSFWGIAPEGAKKHPFAGVTLFKRGFGGELLELMHCQDIPVHWNYNATYWFEIVRKWKRGF